MNYVQSSLITNWDALGDLWDASCIAASQIQYSHPNKYLQFSKPATWTMPRRKNINSSDITLEESDQYLKDQGFEVNNARRGKKKRIAKFKKQGSWQEDSY